MTRIDTTKDTYGPQIYEEWGALGGKKKAKKGFAADPERAKEAGAKGGRATAKKYFGKEYDS